MKNASEITTQAIDEIYSADYGVATKVSKLFAVAMTHYRQPLGDYAGDKIDALIGKEASEALFFLTGFSMGARMKELGYEKIDWSQLL